MVIPFCVGFFVRWVRAGEPGAERDGNSKVAARSAARNVCEKAQTNGNVCAIVGSRSQTTFKSGKQSSQRTRMIAARRTTFAGGERIHVETFADQAREVGANVFLRAACGWASREVERL
jgi:hypothetical protein